MIVLCGIASTVLADDPGGESRKSKPAVRVDEVVVTGSKTEEPQWEATVPTQVIPSEKVEERATLNIEDALVEIPGLYIRRNNQFRLGASTVSMQGADPNKAAILVDGRRVRGGIEGVVDLRDLPANNVERIEVTRGPASSLYGSDAMAGVINIITKTGSPEPHLEGAWGEGSFGRQYYSASHGYQVGPVRYFLSGVHDEFRPFEQYGIFSAQFSGANAREKQVRDQAGLRLDWQASENHRITLSPSVQQQDDPESDVRNLAAGGEWEWRTGRDSRLTTWLNWYNFTRTNDLEDFQEDNDYADWEGESRWATELGPQRVWTGNVVTIGTRVRRQTLDQRLPIPQDNGVWQLSPFLQTDVAFGDRWSLLVGSSFDVHQRYGLDPNPRATLTWRPTSFFRLSATAGRGFRAPDLLQLFDIDANLGGYYVVLGNTDLEPETDLGYTLEAAVRTRGVNGFLSLYRHDFEDLILARSAVACTAPGRPTGCVTIPGGLQPQLVFQYENVAQATTQGLEFGIDVEPLALLDVETAHVVSAGVGYGLLFTENQNGIAGEDGNDLPFSPRHRVIPSVGYRNPDLGFTLRAWGEYQDETFSDLTNLQPTRNYWLWNFKATVAPLALLRGMGPPLMVRATDVASRFAFFVQGDNVFDTQVPDLTSGLQLVGHQSFLFGVNFRF